MKEIEYSFKLYRPEYITATICDPKESTMSKQDTDLSKVQYKAGTYGSTYDNFADAQADASKKALKDWDDVLVWKTVGYAKSNLQPSATTWVDAQEYPTRVGGQRP